MRVITGFTTLCLFLWGIAQQGLSTTTYRLTSDSELLISGTSTLHDWTMSTSAFRGTLSLGEENGQEQLSALVFEVDAGSLVSGKSGMEKDARKALDAEHHPDIRFEQTGALTLEVPAKGLSQTERVLEGTLRIRGRSQPVQIELQIARENKSVRIRGTYPLNMTDYGIEPPRALLGMIKTGEVVEIRFETFWEQP